MRNLITTLTLLPILVIGCTNGSTFNNVLMPSPLTEYSKEVYIVDAFCTYGESSYFYFNFTLHNLTNENIEINYYWTLNDPKADFPGSDNGLNNPLARIYQGWGFTSLSALEAREVKIRIKETREYDPRFYVMYVSVYSDDDLVGYYKEQKSPYDWDYNTTPPTGITVVDLADKADENTDILQLSEGERVKMLEIALADIRFQEITDGLSYHIGRIDNWVTEDRDTKIGGVVEIILDTPQTISYEWPRVTFEADDGELYKKLTEQREVSFKVLYVGVDLRAEEVIKILPLPLPD